jgi:hypothetical protein
MSIVCFCDLGRLVAIVAAPKYIKLVHVATVLGIEFSMFVKPEIRPVSNVS